MDNKPRYKPIFYFLGRYKLLYGAILVLIFISSVVEGFSLAAFFPIFTSVLDDTPETSGILGLISRIVGLIPITEPLIAASVLLISVFSFKTFLMLLRVWLTADASATVLYSVKKQVIERYASAQYQFFLDNKQGVLVFNTLDAPGNVSSLLLHGSILIANIVRVLAIFALLAAIFPLAALGFSVLGLVSYAVIYKLGNRVSFKIGAAKARVAAEQTVTANEFFTGIRHIFASGSTKPWTDRFDRANRLESQLFKRDQIWSSTPRHLMEFAGVLLLLGFVLMVTTFGSGGVTNALPKLGVFAVAMVQILPALNGIGGTWMAILSRMPVVALAYDAITETVPRRTDGNTSLDSFEKAIVFENVDFAHKGRETLLKDANMTFEKGKVTAIVGQSGAGKTTIINLILGLFETSGGRITVDGIPLQELKRETWLNKIGFVSQETFTYHTTVAANILFGKNDHSPEAIRNAAKIAYAHEFISQLPDGYETTVADWGMTLSGGQQQRLAIARAVLDSPEILIFDEATSSLDSISEKLVQEAMDRVSQNRTVIVIAHRISTIKHADKIIVLDNGRVVEEGTHDELIQRGGHFARLAGVSS